MLISTNNYNFSDPLNFSLSKTGYHVEHWQGLHIAMCRYLQLLPVKPDATLRYAHSGDYYAIEFKLMSYTERDDHYEYRVSKKVVILKEPD